MQSFIDLLSATKLQSNKINVAVAGESWFGQNWMAWQLLERWRKTEKNLERIRRKMFLLYVSTLEMAKMAKKRKKSWRSCWRTWQGAPKTVFFLHSYDEKNHSKKIPKKKKSADVRRCWNKIALVNYLGVT